MGGGVDRRASAGGRATPVCLFIGSLLCLLVGYAFVGRGFAYLSGRSGEIGFLLALLVVARVVDEVHIIIRANSRSVIGRRGDVRLRWRMDEAARQRVQDHLSLKALDRFVQRLYRSPAPSRARARARA